MIRKTIGSIVIYGLMMYLIVMIGPSIDFTPYVVYPAQSLNTLRVFFVVGGVIWFVYTILRKILKIVSLPLGMLTFGFTNTVINVGVLYLIPIILNEYQSTFVVTVGSFLEIVMLGVLLAILGLIMKHL